MLKLNIGCGRDYRKGWINIDISEEVETDARLDIRMDMLCADGNDVPIEDVEVDLIYISGVLEQIADNEHLIHALNECWRVLKVGGEMTIVVPNATYAIAHRDPMDIRKFTPATFEYFLGDTQEYHLYGSVYGFKPWKMVSLEENARHIMTICLKK